MNQLLKENCSLLKEHQNIKVGNIAINKYRLFFLYLLLDLSYFEGSEKGNERAFSVFY